jgi:cytochrome c oxidase cbb3-type subunit III
MNVASSSILLLCGLLLSADLVAAQAGSAATAADLVRGRQIFETQCSRCHGIDGSGGMGPDLRHPVLRHASDDSALFHLIVDGIPARGMPAHWDLEDREIRQVVRYVRSLGRAPQVPIVGDPVSGRVIFAGTGGCTACHVIDGSGGTIGPDLSAIGAARGAVALRAALLRPGAVPPTGSHITSGFGEYARFVPVRVVTADGSEILGQRINEDTFTIQIRDVQNRLYSFDKATLRTLDEQFGRSLMPSLAGRLSDRELDDLVAYLSERRGAP